jgi:hypothetical protein
MSIQAQIDNMMRNFEQIDKKQPKVEFIPQREDFCLMIDGKSDGYVYHFTTIVEMLNDGFILKSNEKFSRMTDMSWKELQHFLSNRK